MSEGDRRQTLRREEDEVLTFRMGQVEEQMKIFAPLATQVAIHEHQLDEGNRRMRDLEDGLKGAHEAVDSLVTCVNEVKVKVEGMSVRLSLIVALGSLLGGGVVTLAVALLT